MRPSPYATNCETTVSIVRPFHSIVSGLGQRRDLLAQPLVALVAELDHLALAADREQRVGDAGRVREHRGVEVDPTRLWGASVCVRPVEGDERAGMAIAPTAALKATVRRGRRHLARIEGPMSGIANPFVTRSLGAIDGDARVGLAP